MAGETQFKVNEPLPIVYQAPGAESGLSGVVAEIVLPTGVKDMVNFPDVILVEVMATGTYQGTFTPNVIGEWILIIHKADENGKVIKRYSVGSHNVHTVGEAVGGVNVAVAVVDGKVVVVENKVDGVDTKVTTVDGKADQILTAVNNINTQVGGLDAPAMVS